MKRSLKPALALAAVLAMIGGARSEPAQPQQVCAALPALRQALKEQGQEIEKSGGMLSDDQSVMLIFSRPDGKTWTALVAGPDGKACTIAHGTGWYEGHFHIGDQQV